MPERGFLTKMVSLGFKRLVALAERDGHQGDAIHLAQSRRRLCRDYVVGLPVDAVTECHSEWIDADLEAARLLQAADRLQESEATLDEAAEAAASLYDQQPGVWDYASLSARVCQQRAELAVVRGEPDAARLLFARAASLMAPYRATPAQRNETEAQLAAAQAGLDRLGGGSSERLATSDLQSEALSRP